MEARRIALLATPKRQRPSRQSIHAQFQHITDPTGVNAYNLFLQHYSQNNLPPPEVGHEALELYERYTNGSHRHNQKKYFSKRNLKTARQDARKSYNQPFVQQRVVENSTSKRLDVQKLPSQSNLSGSAAHMHLGNQYVSQPGASGSGHSHRNTNPQKSSADVAHDLNKQYNIQCPQSPHNGDHSGSGDTHPNTNPQKSLADVAYDLNKQYHIQCSQSPHYGHNSGSGNSHPYNNPPMSPAEDLCEQFDIHSPQHLDFDEHRPQINPSASVAIDNYHMYLSHKYRGQSEGSGSG